MMQPPSLYKYSYKHFSCGQVIKHFVQAAIVWLQSKHVLVILNDCTIVGGGRSKRKCSWLCDTNEDSYTETEK